MSDYLQDLDFLEEQEEPCPTCHGAEWIRNPRATKLCGAGYVECPDCGPQAKFLQEWEARMQVSEAAKDMEEFNFVALGSFLTN